MNRILKTYVDNWGIIVKREYELPKEKKEYDECWYYFGGYDVIEAVHITRTSDVKSLNKQIYFLSLKIRFLNPDIDSSVVYGYIELLLDMPEVFRKITKAIDNVYSLEITDIKEEKLISRKKIKWKLHWENKDKDSKMNVVWNVMSDILSSKGKKLVEGAIKTLIESDSFTSPTTIAMLIKDKGEVLSITTVKKYIKEFDKVIAIHNMKIFGCSDGREYRRVTNVITLSETLSKIISSGDLVSKYKIAKLSGKSRQTVINNWDSIKEQYRLTTGEIYNG